MSLNETPLLHRYWQMIGGTLVEEFVAVQRGRFHGERRIDGIIIKNEIHDIKNQDEVDIAGKDIIVIQVKAKRLSMTLMGQAVFSHELMKKFNPRSIETVALCKKDDSVLRPLLAKYPNITVIIDDK